MDAAQSRIRIALHHHFDATECKDQPALPHRKSTVSPSPDTAVLAAFLLLV
jgi:hypothetical protein